jgi:RNA polymerase sigma-70 factor (ECF subfamily)
MRDDLDLLRAWQAGDGAAGRELFERHWGGVYGFLRAKLPAAAADLAQQTFEGLLRDAARAQQGGSVRGLLFAIARNVLVDHLRRASRRREIDTTVSSLQDLAPSPSQLVAEREEHRALFEALRRIPLDQQIALELFYWQELPASEIAQVIGVPEGTVRSRLRLGLRALHQGLARLRGEPAGACDEEHVARAFAEAQRSSASSS